MDDTENDHQNQASISIFEINSSHVHDPRENVPLPLSDLTPQMFEDLIGGSYLERENLFYRDGRHIKPDIKLIYLAGISEEDLVGAKSPVSGDLIYTKKVDEDTVKTDEVLEATAAIIYFNEHGKDPALKPAIVSEVSDLFYNLIHMKVLDPDFASIYQECMEAIAETFGFTLRQALFITSVKYWHRLYEQNGKKEVERENAIIGSFMESIDGHDAIIPTPTNAQIKAVYHLMNKFKKGMFGSRLNQMVDMANVKRELKKNKKKNTRK